MGVPTARLIDQKPEAPKGGVEMEVLVLGMPRTGTLCELDIRLTKPFLIELQSSDYFVC